MTFDSLPYASRDRLRHVRQHKEISMKPTLLRLTYAVLVATGITTALAADKTTLLVYTALETDQLKAYKEGFEKSNPDIAIKWVRDSTGVITAKLVAEKANPQADVVMGVAASSLTILDQEQMLAKYEPKGFKDLSPKFADAGRPPSWVGMDVWGATVCFNTVEAQKRGL